MRGPVAGICPNALACRSHEVICAAALCDDVRADSTEDTHRFHEQYRTYTIYMSISARVPVCSPLSFVEM